MTVYYHMLMEEIIVTLFLYLNTHEKEMMECHNIAPPDINFFFFLQFNMKRNVLK